MCPLLPTLSHLSFPRPRHQVWSECFFYLPHKCPFFSSSPPLSHPLWDITKCVGVKIKKVIWKCFKKERERERATMKKAQREWRGDRRRVRESVRVKEYDGSGCPEFNQANIEEHSEPFFDQLNEQMAPAQSREITLSDWAGERRGAGGRCKGSSLHVKAETLRFETQPPIRRKEKSQRQTVKLTVCVCVLFFVCMHISPHAFLFFSYLYFTCVCERLSCSGGA